MMALDDFNFNALSPSLSLLPPSLHLSPKSCVTIVIGNGTACRETEAYFADLIMKRYFAPLDVTYW